MLMYHLMLYLTLIYIKTFNIIDTNYVFHGASLSAETTQNGNCFNEEDKTQATNINRSSAKTRKHCNPKLLFYLIMRFLICLEY